MRLAALLMAIAAQLIAAPVTARERLLAPTDEWRVESADEYCLLIRNFAGPTGETIRLQLQSFGPVEGLKITMIGDGLPLRDGQRRGVATFRYRFKPDTRWREGSGTTGYVNGIDALTFWGDIATREEADRRRKVSDREGTANTWATYTLARAAEVNALALAYPSRDDTVLQLGSLSEPFRALGECAQSLIRRWGYDPAQQGSLRAGPELLNPKEISDAVLGIMLHERLGHNDTIHFRIDIDANGSQTGCTVQHPRRGTEVEALICDILRKRARFAPALDENGAPVAAPYVSTVIFGVR